MNNRPLTSKSLGRYWSHGAWTEFAYRWAFGCRFQMGFWGRRWGVGGVGLHTIHSSRKSGWRWDSQAEREEGILKSSHSRKKKRRSAGRRCIYFHLIVIGAIAMAVDRHATTARRRLDRIWSGWSNLAPFSPPPRWDVDWQKWLTVCLVFFATFTAPSICQPSLFNWQSSE